MTHQIEWSNQLGSRDRKPWLLFVRGDEVIPFAGKDIPGLVVVRNTDYKKSGKWSQTIYRLQVADGVRHIAGRDGWETGRFAEGLGQAVGQKTPDTWPEIAQALGVSVPSAMEFLRSWRPKAAARLDEVEQALADLEEESSKPASDSNIVTVSFGKPSNRAIREGYWESPKEIPGYAAEIRLKNRDLGWNEGNIEIVGISGTVISVKHSAGMHGGYYAVAVAVIPGTETEIPPFETARKKAAKESGLPEDLFLAFDGDTAKVKAFMEKVSRLDFAKLNEHEISCGRDRQKVEIIRVSGDSNFFLGADPLEVMGYVFRTHCPDPQDYQAPDQPFGALGDALKRANLGPKA